MTTYTSENFCKGEFNAAALERFRARRREFEGVEPLHAQIGRVDAGESVGRQIDTAGVGPANR